MVSVDDAVSVSVGRARNVVDSVDVSDSVSVSVGRATGGNDSPPTSPSASEAIAERFRSLFLSNMGRISTVTDMSMQELATKCMELVSKLIVGSRLMRCMSRTN